MIASLYIYFRYREAPGIECTEAWFKQCEYIPDEADENIVKKFMEFDNLPRNVPRAIKRIYAEHQRGKPRFKHYDPIEDPDFPIDLMFTALEVLANKGQEDFARYCESVSMPATDRERVVGKYKTAFNVKNLTDGMLSDVEHNQFTDDIGDELPF